jgi:hypothetical protein
MPTATGAGFTTPWSGNGLLFDTATLNGKRITGIGNALVDMLVHESAAFVERSGAAPGGMTYFDRAHIEAVAARASEPPAVVPGGAVCNTMIGIGRLGHPARFIGKRGRDSRGEFLEADLKSKGVDPVLRVANTSTGRVLSIITPDAQRTMLTYLGAAAELTPGGDLCGSVRRHSHRRRGGLPAVQPRSDHEVPGGCQGGGGPDVPRSVQFYGCRVLHGHPGFDCWSSMWTFSWQTRTKRGPLPE